jgi:ABC-type branched-subunit amino acid transport system substrate-binding protein
MSSIDFTSQVLSMKRAGITHALVFHVGPVAAALLKGLKSYDFDIPVFGTSASTTEDLITISGEQAKNYTGTAQYSSWYEETPGTKKMREISMKYNPDVFKSYGVRSYSVGWTRSLILCEGIKRAGKDLNGETLVSALETLKGFDTQGLCGLINYTPTIHHTLRYSKLFKANPLTGRFVPITDWRLPPGTK